MVHDISSRIPCDAAYFIFIFANSGINNMIILEKKYFTNALHFLATLPYQKFRRSTDLQDLAPNAAASKTLIYTTNLFSARDGIV